MKEEECWPYGVFKAYALFSYAGKAVALPGWRRIRMFRKKKPATEQYDKAAERPVIHASICNGEQVAGFVDLQTKKFTEVMLIRGAQDLEEFCRRYGVEQEDIVKEY